MLRKNEIVGLSFAAVLAVCLVTVNAQAAPVQVGSCVTGLTSYPTISAAVAAVAPGATVDVCPGTYAEQVTITNAIKLTGVFRGFYDAPVVVPPSGGLAVNGSDIFGNPVAAQIFVLNASGVTVENLTVDGTGNQVASCGITLEGIYFQDSSGTISSNVVRNQYQTDFADFGGCQNGLAINVEDNTGSSVVTIKGNSVRAYQKNGITATGAATGPGSVGPSVTLKSNYVVGLAATAMNWQGVYLSQQTAGENGIQIGFGASGTVTANTVLDNIWGEDTSGDPGDAASGILVYASSGITISQNQVGSAQFGITVDSDLSSTSCNGGPCGPADNSVITKNVVIGTQIFDAIDACSNSNTVTGNTAVGSTESGVHIDDTCGSGNNNTVTGNKITEACAGVLLGKGTGNTFSPNTYSNVTYATFGGDTCSAPLVAGVRSQAAKQAQRPSPYTPKQHSAAKKK